jgi:general secretion pathway protein A
VDNSDLSKSVVLYALLFTACPQFKNFLAKFFLIQRDFLLAIKIENDYELALTELSSKSVSCRNTIKTFMALSKKFRKRTRWRSLAKFPYQFFEEDQRSMEAINLQERTGMFENYFGFRESPFGVAPDPRFFYSSPPYLEGLAALVYGIRAKKGLMLVTGEVGTGKTILLRKLMRQLESSVRFVFISSSHITSYSLVELMVQDLQLPMKERNRLEMMHELNSYLIEQLKQGHSVSLLVDEGQNLSDDALEGLCGLSNLETDEEKLLQIVLVGQPELAAKLSRPGFRRIKQRIAIHHRLVALQSIDEVEDYVRHRLQVAGYDGPEIYNKEAIEAIWHYSAGTPRLVNIICDNTLSIACEAAKKRVSAYMVMRAASTLLLEDGHEGQKPVLPELGASRVKSAATKNSQKRSLAVAANSPNGRLNGNPIACGGTSPQTEISTVPSRIFDYMTRIATAAMGPMAPLVLRDQLSALGESQDAFPQPKLSHLVELVSREILNESMRLRFQDMMAEEIDALSTPDVA